MDSPTPPGSPVLDKSRLFVHLPTNPQDETTRYLECEGTGHLYCMSTGSLLQKKVPNITSSANILLLNPRKISSLLPRNPTPCTMKTFFENASIIDQQCNSASASIESKTSLKVKDVDQPTRGDSAVIPKSNIAPKLKNAHQPMQANETSKILNTKSNRTRKVKHGGQLIQGDRSSGIQNISSKVKNKQSPNVNNTDTPVQCKAVSSISKTTSKVKHAGGPIQGNKSSSIFPYIQCNKNPRLNKADQPMLGTNESRTPKAQRNKASKSKSDPSSQANISIQSAIHSNAPNNSNFVPTTKKKIIREYVNNTDKPVQCKGVSSISKTTSKVKHAGGPIQGNKSSSIFPYIQCNKNPRLNKADQPMLGTNESRTLKAQRNKASKSKSDPSGQANISIQSAIHSNAPNNSNFNTTTKKKRKKGTRKAKHQSTGIPLPENDSTICKKKSASSKQKSTEHPQSKPTTSGNQNPAAKTRKKKRKNFRPVRNTLNIWAILKPFNRRPHPSRHRQKSLLSSQSKNCIMDSSVHEIINSQFAKNEKELLPDSQIRVMLNSGDRKLRTRKKWVQRMEEEAIHKYKKMNLENHNQRVHVKEYEVLHHELRFWLACSSRSVINKKTKESWPLLVKCLHKYPDSTLRQACKHRSFCLSWNGIWYSLRIDHAYYTQIQCHMAITNTSYADLVVHTNKETTILRVNFNSEFWKQTECY